MYFVLTSFGCWASPPAISLLSSDFFDKTEAEALISFKLFFVDLFFVLLLLLFFFGFVVLFVVCELVVAFLLFTSVWLCGRVWSVWISFLSCPILRSLVFISSSCKVKKKQRKKVLKILQTNRTFKQIEWIKHFWYRIFYFLHQTIKGLDSAANDKCNNLRPNKLWEISWHQSCYISPLLLLIKLL